MLKKWSSVFFLLSISLTASAQRFPFPPFCNPLDSWKTVDTVESIGTGSALLAGVVAYKNYAYAVGSAQLNVLDTGSWVIRRSTDYGETWSTAKVLLGGGRGIAVDPRNGILYSIGGVYNRSPEAFHDWVVQKSTDNGTTWTKLDDFFESEHNYTSGRITVDGKGNVIIVGQDYTRDGGSVPIMRRSEDGGATWSTINYAEKPFFGNQIAASTTGQVIVVGGLQNSDQELGNTWAVRHSHDGVTNWKQVDLFKGSATDPKVSTFASGISIQASTGRVVVAGGRGKGFEGTSRMIVRESNLLSITSWSTSMSYQPFDRRLGSGSASAAHIALMNNRRFLINGTQRGPRSFIEDNITLDKRAPFAVRVVDKITNSFESPFQHEYIYTGGLTKLSNGQALSGYIKHNESSKSWFIRKMTCPF